MSPERATPAEADEFAVQELSHSPTKRRSGGLAAWFEGSSAPVNIGLVSPQKEKLDPVQEVGVGEEFFSASQDSLNNLTQRPQKRPSLPATTSSTMSKFNIFRRSTTTLTPAEDINELSQIEVQDVLFPHGRPDEFSPAAFKNLELNADGAIRRLQQAYKDQQQWLKAVVSTKNVQADELAATETRNEHLKLQLQEMAERAAEQEKIITEMRSKLATQRAVLELHERSIRLVPQARETSPRPEYRRKRVSDVSDAGSDASSTASVFSEQLSIAPSQATSADPTDTTARIDCPRCHGMRPSDAWDVVGVLKTESAALKQRISILESAHDDAMDLINGTRLSR